MSRSLKVNIVLCVLLSLLLLNTNNGYSQDREYSQLSTISGLHIGGGIGWLGWISDDLNFEEYLSSAGIRIGADYGINELVSFGIQYLHSFNIEDYTGGKDFNVNSFQLGGKIHLGTSLSAWRPYGGIQLTFNNADPELVILDTGQLGISDLKGLGASLEAGIQYFFNPRTKMYVSANYLIGKYSSVVVAGTELTQKIDFTNIYLGFGVTYQVLQP